MTGLYRTDTEALDECLRLMFPDLESDDFRTDGGNINMPKVRTLWRERQAASGVPPSDQGCAAHGLSHPCEACAVEASVEQALDAFERKERGIPQAHMAADLVREVRAAIAGVALPADQQTKGGA